MNGQPLTIPVMGFQSPYSHELGGQQPNTTYDLSMSAVTDFIKEGPKSDSITVTTLALGLFYMQASVNINVDYTLYCRVHYAKYCSGL